MAIRVKKSTQTDLAISDSGISTLQDLVKESSEKIAFENLLNQVTNESSTDGRSQTLDLIMNLFEKTIENIDEKANPDYLHSHDVKIVKSMIDWCITNWFNISERIRSDRAVFDICAMYEQYNRAQP